MSRSAFGRAIFRLTRASTRGPIQQDRLPHRVNSSPTEARSWRPRSSARAVTARSRRAAQATPPNHTPAHIARNLHRLRRKHRGGSRRPPPTPTLPHPWWEDREGGPSRRGGPRCNLSRRLPHPNHASFPPTRRRGGFGHRRPLPRSAPPHRPPLLRWLVPLLRRTFLPPSLVLRVWGGGERCSASASSWAPCSSQARGRPSWASTFSETSPPRHRPSPTTLTRPSYPIPTSPPPVPRPRRSPPLSHPRNRSGSGRFRSRGQRV